MLVVFDLDDNIDMSHLPKYDVTMHGLTMQCVFDLAVMSWIEHHCPLKYSARLSKTDVMVLMIEDQVSGVLEDYVHGNADVVEDVQDKVYHLVNRAYSYVDRVLINSINPLSLIRLDDIRWHGSNCHVSIHRGL